MAAAAELALWRLHDQAPGKPIYIVGYSTGAALAVQYALKTLEEPDLPKVDGLAVISPSIDVTGAAALAVWQARIDHLLELDKLAWNSIGPEYDPFKYNSFAVNAGDQVYRLTLAIQSRFNKLDKIGRLKKFPPVLAFQSVVDATVSTSAVVDGRFNRLPVGGHDRFVAVDNEAAPNGRIIVTKSSRRSPNPVCPRSPIVVSATTIPGLGGGTVVSSSNDLSHGVHRGRRENRKNPRAKPCIARRRRGAEKTKMVPVSPGNLKNLKNDFEFDFPRELCVLREKHAFQSAHPSKAEITLRK